MILKIIFIGILLFIGFCILSLIVFNKDVEKKMKNREKFKYLKICSKTLEYDDIDTSVFHDKQFTLVNFWGTYCSSCVEELPYLQEIYNEFKDDNIGVLGIVSDLKFNNFKEKDLLKAKDILHQNNIKYPNIFVDSELVKYITGKLFVIPTTLFVDNKGNIIGDIIESACSKEEFVAIIKNILNDDTTTDFKFENHDNISCSIDGKCEIKNKSNTKDAN